ncbi:hypothetical protein PRZ48_014808 [Zasmidium cellare]|uniref:Protein arginine N-methyltransferase n=1 Tax=Zasmidium cellare TaxID=395010 RepID=A0ABR0DZE3_ZASCE|nr:hypothetical protein PRZ48_014808 [Zasmidium cellare]
MDPNAEEPAPILFIGQHESQREVSVNSQLLGDAQSLGYDLLTAPITTTHFQSRVLTILADYVKLISKNTLPDALPLPNIPPLLPKDTDLSPEDSNSALIAVASPWIDLGSKDPLIAHISRQVLNAEVAYAAFVGISSILVQGPVQGSDVAQYSRAILEALNLGPYVQIHIVMPMTGELEMEGFDGEHLSELARKQYVTEEDEDDDSELEPFAAWETWDTIRSFCNYSQKLTGYPVLSKTHQQLLTRFLRLRFPPWLLLVDVDAIKPMEEAASGGAPLEPTPAESAKSGTPETKDPVSHLRYIRHLQQTQPSRPPMERFGQGYQDYIQSPLQPLTDNLESITYEVFEKDPVKYEWYERAVAAALKDLRKKLGEKHEIVVAVVGAGRGPLVTRSLRASKSTGIPIKCCAVEKNPNAHVLIQRRNATDPLWNGQVLIYKSDMRAWPGPTVNGEVRQVDILVSELLGSFADNELSPECLDGVQHVLHPDHGINIPQSYSAHLTPIATPRIYSDLLTRPADDLWETPAVVMLHQYDDLCTITNASGERTPDVKETWSFHHPIAPAILTHAFVRAGGASDAGGWTGGDGKNEHNVRSCKVSFKAQDRGVCHGLAGYFETVLYAPEDGSKKVELSTNPVTMKAKSEDMISWFPIFFPLKKPIFVPDDAEIEVSMWRQTDDRKVWYEWFVEVFAQGAKGKRVKVGSSELHSSKKNGCLM